MVSKKRLYYGGFDGFRAPVVPKAPRSLRRNWHKKSSEGSEICPFELLAAVAGKLLEESESSASSTGSEGKEQISIPKDGVKQEPLDVKLKPLRLEYLDQGCCAESGFVHEHSNPELKIEPLLTDLPQSDNDSGLEHASVVTTSDFLKEVGTNVQLEASDGKHGVDGPLSGDLCDVNMDTNRAELHTEAVEKQSEDLTAVKTCSFRDTGKSSVNHGVLSKSYSSVHVPFFSDPVPSACFPKHKGNVKIGIRDDDENSFSCNHHSTKMRAFRLQSRAGYRRIRKILTAKYWKAAPKLKDYELSNPTSGGVNPFDHNKKNMYMRKCCQAEAASKRRKLFHHSLKSDYVQEASSESISNLHERSARGDKKRSPAASKRARGVTSSVINHKGSFQSKDGHVKFSIKSFKVPELHVEMPETSTVGSLKRTIMEAVTAILGGELHVGVLVQGKKVRDDNRTLQQTGISLNSDTLGFMLEPNLPQPSESLIQEEHPLLLPCDTHQSPARGPATPITDLGLSNSLGDPPSATSLDNQVEMNRESKPLPDEVSTEEIVVDSKALVPVPAMNVEALSIVPLNHKQSKRSELSQRRTRRPFSVSEVEALVEAVETLGTGRWRDVKIRAFDDANHRTYVDLKDKWKTLVHTASISPQQRRGEPVPQDLLDRVLAAHAYWSQHQSKQQGKHQSEGVGSPVKVCLELES
ncbi:telomere repeat-binding protein 2 [Cynara cardunculus var. scolymus]|uniref:Homeodomain-like protein n=1 Tax=Cynara cardunculus var. scolymus TaxID=59895 RepID=A0A124SHK3_CYNCS|nr:telomere repeat-binding protein 2 [Cynara cardunculus var. scolymus]XP_024960380.1 telomere repeat-binding protein 2 [Cynara cardunculus var. scolymus]KVI09828.1 Homeodomain-like protein [Cynara cardunculus var. scolymus]